MWAAFLPQVASVSDAGHQRTDVSSQALADAVSGLSTWALQFTPRVAVIEPEGDSPAVVMEVEASVRLFGGKRRLVGRVREEASALGAEQVSWAPTSLGAVALGRARQSNGFAAPLGTLLDALPIHTLTSVGKHQATLARLGCLTLGQVRALPRGGLSRRFDGQLLAALDQAYGLRPEAHEWVVLPDVFRARLELMARVELAPALLFGARRLLLQLSAWLTAKHSGVTAFTFHWWHDTMRSRSAGTGGSLTIRTARLMRDVEHLGSLLAEQLAKVELLAPVGDIELTADEVESLEEASLSLVPDVRVAGEGLALVLERLAARLGPERVLRPLALEDHRPEWMCQWQAADVQRPKRLARVLDVPQPTFILAQPLRLAMQGPHPMYQGALQLLSGPHRVEGGWWDRMEEGGSQCTRNVSRDYWIAVSEHAGVLWIFQTRLAESESAAQTAWYLHGTFA